MLEFVDPAEIPCIEVKADAGLSLPAYPDFLFSSGLLKF
jgi:hypothetical protein